MAYQAKRENKVIEYFELVNERGEVVERIRVELNPGACIDKLSRKYVDLLRAHSDMYHLQSQIDNNEILRDAYEKLGHAVVDLLEAVFGHDDTEKIVGFYENNYAEIVKEVAPFISNVVIPRVREAVKENKKQILSSYNRKARRSIMKVIG